MQGEPKSPAKLAPISGVREAPPDIRIFFVDLDSAAAGLEVEEERTPRLSAADVERAEAMKNIEARRLWRASRIATRIALERIVGPGLRQIPFEIEPGGRPVLPGRVAHFSISHTGSAALIAVSTSMPLGVDLERRARPLKMSPDRRHRIVAAAGRLAAQPLLSADNDADVIAAWVRLEAVAKALGIGIGRLLTQEGVVGGEEGKKTDTARRVAVRHLTIDPEHVAVVAAECLPETLAVEIFPHTTLDAFVRG
ncbi:4'-phosphopantetheinyl transferase family protein [Hyphomicrobium sp. DY-1]|uniref:4'-phosphopantetheinyl transferase family protein n=1 Tax=Hyphomicrobium sp. DY-1 TaxID=3075650 RepID=UPI0039C47B6E